MITEINRRKQETIFTECEITFPCGCVTQVDIAHFIADASMSDEQKEAIINEGKANREVSETNTHVCPVNETQE